MSDFPDKKEENGENFYDEESFAKNFPQVDETQSSEQGVTVGTQRGNWHFGLLSIFGIILWHFLVGILLNLMTAAAASLLCAAIIGLIFNGILGFIAIPDAVSYVTIAIVSVVIVILFVYLFRRRIAKYDRRYVPIAKRKSYDRLWHRRIKKNKIVNIYAFQVVLLIFLAIAVVCAVFAVMQYLKISRIGSTNDIEWVEIAGLGISAITWFAYWLSLVLHYAKSTCECKHVMSFVEIRREGDGISNTNQSRTARDGRTERRTISYNYWTAVCRCAYCGKEKIINDESPSTKVQWKDPDSTQWH